MASAQEKNATPFLTIVSKEVMDDVNSVVGPQEEIETSGVQLVNETSSSMSNVNNVGLQSSEQIRNKKWMKVESCVNNCHLRINERQQKQIYENYWLNSSVSARYKFINNMTKLSLTKESEKNSIITIGEKVLYSIFFLNTSDGCKSVCKSCFRLILGELESFITAVITQKIFPNYSVAKSQEENVTVKQEGSKNVKKNNASQLPPCHIKCHALISSNDEKKILFNYWHKKTIEQRCKFIWDMTEVRENEKFKSKSSNFNKPYYSTFFINTEKGRKSICPNCFQTILKEESCIISEVLDEKWSIVSSELENGEKYKEVVQHLNKFPLFESHHVADNNTEKYLPIGLTLQVMYDLYREEVPNPVSFPSYKKIFSKTGLQFLTSILEHCLRCESASVQSRTSILFRNKIKMESFINTHLNSSYKSHNFKFRDEKKKNQALMVCTFRFHDSLPAPFLNEHVCYYKEPIWTYNFTIKENTEMRSNASLFKSFVWDETQGQKSVNEIATCLNNYLQDLPSNIRHIIFYSTSCGGKSRSKLLCMILSNLVVNHKTLNIIEHKFLLDGHFYVDKNKTHDWCQGILKEEVGKIESPQDWYKALIETAKLCNNQVIVLNNEMFFDFENYLGGVFERGTSGGMIDDDVTCIQYTKNGSISFKRKWSGVYEEVQPNSNLLPRRINFRVEELNRIARIPISKKKKNGLLDLLPFLTPRSYDFYLTLPVQNYFTYVQDPSINLANYNPAAIFVLTSDKLNLISENDLSANKETEKLTSEEPCAVVKEEIPMEFCTVKEELDYEKEEMFNRLPEAESEEETEAELNHTEKERELNHTEKEVDLNFTEEEVDLNHTEEEEDLNHTEREVDLNHTKEEKDFSHAEEEVELNQTESSESGQFLKEVLAMNALFSSNHVSEIESFNRKFYENDNYMNVEKILNTSGCILNQEGPLLGHCQNLCYLKVLPKDQERIFTSYWYKGTAETRFEHLCEMIKLEPKGQNNEKSAASDVKFTIKFCLNTDHGLQNVCKFCFLKVLAEREADVITVIKLKTQAFFDAIKAEIQNVENATEQTPNSNFENEDLGTDNILKWKVSEYDCPSSKLLRTEKLQKGLTRLQACRNGCFLTITNDDQEQIFNSYWQGATIHSRYYFIQASVKNSKEPGSVQEQTNIWRKYFLSSSKGPQRVCKRCFCIALGETVKFVESVLKKASVQNKQKVIKTSRVEGLRSVLKPQAERMKSISTFESSVHVSKSTDVDSASSTLERRDKPMPIVENLSNEKTSQIRVIAFCSLGQIKQAEEHIKKFLVAKSNENYPSKKISVQMMYADYFAEIKKPLTIGWYQNILSTSSVDFKAPFVDKCQECESSASLFTATDDPSLKNKICESLTQHIVCAQIIYKYKFQEEESARLINSLMVCSFGFQQNYLIPAKNNSSRRSLAVFNLTVWEGLINNVIAKPVFYVWPQVEGKRSANEIASCLFQYFKRVTNQQKSLIIYSSSCHGESKSKTLASMLSYLTANHKTLVSVDHKFGYTGHSQLKEYLDDHWVDDALSNSSIKADEPLDWYKNFQDTVLRKNPNFVFMEPDMFYDFESLWKDPSKKENPYIDKNVLWMKYTKNGNIFFKKSLSEKSNFEVLNFKGVFPFKDLLNLPLRNLYIYPEVRENENRLEVLPPVSREHCIIKTEVEFDETKQEFEDQDEENQDEVGTSFKRRKLEPAEDCARSKRIRKKKEIFSL